MISPGTSISATLHGDSVLGRRLRAACHWLSSKLFRLAPRGVVEKACLSVAGLLALSNVPSQGAHAMSAFYEDDTESFPVRVVVEGELRGEPFRLERTSYCYSYFEFSHVPNPRWAAFARNFGEQLTPLDGVIINTRIKCDPKKPKGKIKVKNPGWTWVRNICNIKIIENNNIDRRSLDINEFDDFIFPLKIIFQYYYFDI
jgi:hypothetical protein